MNNQEIIKTVDGEIKSQTRGMFDFLMKSNMHFEGKKDNEEMLVFTRRHWIILIRPIFTAIIASVLPFLIIVVAAPLLIKYQLAPMFTLAWSLYIMILWAYLFHTLTMHSLDTWIVTTERVIDISQIGFFQRKVSELHLSSIEDISVHVNGVLQSYFDFGNLEIQTAGSSQRFLFEEIPDPIIVKDKIMNASIKHRDHHR